MIDEQERLQIRRALDEVEHDHLLERVRQSRRRAEALSAPYAVTAEVGTYRVRPGRKARSLRWME